MGTRRFGTWTFGLMLVLLGLALLYGNITGTAVAIARYWPLGLVLLGLELLIIQLTGAAEDQPVRIGCAGVFALVIVAVLGVFSVVVSLDHSLIGTTIKLPGTLRETVSAPRAITADFQGIGKVRLVTEFGNMNVVAVPEGTVPRLTAGITAQADSKKVAGDLVEAVSVDVECVAGVMTVTVRGEVGDGTGRVRADLDVLLLPDVELEVRSRFGNVSVRGLSRSVCVDTVYGDVSLQALDGPVTVTCTHGDLRAGGLFGGLTFTGTYGDADCRDVGPGANLETRHGAIDLRRPSGTVVAESTYGSVRVYFEAPPEADCLLRSKHKEVLAEIPAASAVTVTAVSERSAVRTNLPLEVTREGTSSCVREQRLNGGGAKIDAFSTYGEVEVLGR